MKKFYNLVLCLICCVSLFNVSNIFAESNSNESSDNSNVVVIDLMMNKNNIQVVSDEYNIPIEVQQSIERIYQNNPNSIVSVSNIDVKKARASSGFWTPTRVYNKYQLQDWIITGTGSTGSKVVKTGTKTSSVLDKIGFAIGSALVDTIFPFSSTTISVLDAFNVGGTYTAEGRDNLDVSIKITTREKFTYVIIAGKKMLGAKSYYSTFNEAAWTFYSEKLQKHFQKITTYNKNYSTYSYSFPDQRAVTSFGNGGYIDEPPTIKIGLATFALY